VVIAQYVSDEVQHLGHQSLGNAGLAPEHAGLMLLGLLGVEASHRMADAVVKDHPNPRSVALELLCLQSVAVDFAVYMAYGYSQTWDAVLKSFNQHLRTALKSLSGFNETLLDRHAAYTTCLKTHYADAHTPRTTVGSVGAQFAAFCGGPDIFLMFQGETYFWETVKVAREMLQHTPISPVLRHNDPGSTTTA
jgi:hypothetical protein